MENRMIVDIFIFRRTTVLSTDIFWILTVTINYQVHKIQKRNWVYYYNSTSLMENRMIVDIFIFRRKTLFPQIFSGY